MFAHGILKSVEYVDGGVVDVDVDVDVDVSAGHLTDRIGYRLKPASRRV